MIELMLVLAVIAMLLTLVAPRYFHQERLAREDALQYNLLLLRKTLDDYRADKGEYPQSLQALVAERYLRAIPDDPVTERSDTWRTLAESGRNGGVYDVKSGASGAASDGSRYADW